MSDDILHLQLLDIIRNKEMSNDIKLAKIDMLIRLGVDVNAKSVKNGSALLVATAVGNLPIIEYLVSSGADVNITTITGLGVTPLLLACQNGDNDIVEFLIEKGARLNMLPNAVNTPLNMAIDYGHKEVVETLIKNGVRVNEQVVFPQIYISPLVKAIKKENKDIVEILIKNGAKVNQQDAIGYTPLMYASQKGNVEIVKLLIKKGADVNIKNKVGFTALKVAKDEKTQKAIIDAVKDKKVKSVIFKVKKCFLGKGKI